MKTLIIVLAVASFLQATIVPFDLVLLILICRAFIKINKVNLYLAFIFGLLVSHLTLTTLGLQSILFLIFVAITQSLSKSRLSQNALLIVPICFAAIGINQIVVSTNIYGGFLSLPIFYLVRLWEERFIVRKEIRLKI